MYSIEAVGVEYDAEMADKSLRNLDNLTQLGSKRADWQVVQGDFMDNKTYEKTGIEFQQFDIVFNYINNQRDIAMKVFEESPAGTAFWLLGAFPVPGFQGLYLERNLELVQDNVELPLIRVNDVAGDVLPSYGPMIF